MHVPFTLLTMLHQRRRTTIAVAGVAFANLLIFMQLGFLGSAQAAAVILLEQFDYDLILVAPEYHNGYRPGTIPSVRLYQLLGQPEIERVVPLHVSSSYWRIVAPQEPSRHGQRRTILVVGVEIGDQPFRLPALRPLLERLREPNTVLVDTSSRSTFGNLSTGVETELGLTRVRIVDHFTIGTGFGADGLVLTSAQTFARINGSASLERISLGLIKLRHGCDPDAVAARIRAALPGGPREPLRLLTRRAFEEKEVRFWVKQTPLGLIFVCGVLVAFAVGIVFVYQIISSDIRSRRPEYATLRAIGYSDLALTRMVLVQAVCYGALGYLPALGAAVLLYAWIARTALLPIAMTPARAAIVFALGLVMCTLSGLLAMQRVKGADPADLF